MTKGQMPMVRVETLAPVKSYTRAQLHRAIMIATVYRIGVFVLTAPPEHA
jgi:hypothetical protein